MSTPTSDAEETEPIVVLSEGELPEFEGRIPVAVQTNLQGAGQRITRAMHHEDRIVLVVEAKVSDVRHPMTKDGLKRVHVLKVEDLYEMPGRPGQRLLSRLKVAWRLADDQRHGRTALEGLAGDTEGVELTTDGSGVVLTPEELAELGLSDSTSDPRVVIYEGGARAMWPDDYPAGQDRPEAGEYGTPPGQDDVDFVAELLDPLTGETVATWSEEDEEARLLAEEQRLEAEEEAAADRGDAEPDGDVPAGEPWTGYDRQPAKVIISNLTTEVDDIELCARVYAYEEAGKGRAGVLRTAMARRDTLDRQAKQAEAEREAAIAEHVPPLPGEEG